jgi:hypothetical protein
VWHLHESRDRWPCWMAQLYIPTVVHLYNHFSMFISNQHHKWNMRLVWGSCWLLRELIWVQWFNCSCWSSVGLHLLYLPRKLFRTSRVRTVLRLGVWRSRFIPSISVPSKFNMHSSQCLWWNCSKLLYSMWILHNLLSVCSFINGLLTIRVSHRADVG